jgi:hypothetical protein
VSGPSPVGVPVELWQAVADVADARVRVLEQALVALRAGAADAPARCAEAFDESHKLVGSLDSWGRTGGSGLALRAAGLLEQPRPDVAALADVLGALRRTVDGTAPPAA